MYYQGRTQFYKGQGEVNHTSLQNTIISDIASNYSTIASMSNEDIFTKRYFHCNQPESSGLTHSSKLALLYAISNASIFLLFYCLYKVMIEDVERGYDFKNLFISVFVSIWG